MPLIQENSLIAVFSPTYETSLFYEDLIEKFCLCESGGKEDIVVWDMGSYSYGILQFKKPTWNAYCKGDIMSGDDQKECMNNMLLESWDNIWNWANCAKKIL